MTFAQPTNVTYAGEETRPPDLLALDPELPVPTEAGPGPSASHGHRRVLLSADPESAAAAREFTTATLHSWQLDDVISEAVLIATELVTNAIRHGGCCAGPGQGGAGGPGPWEVELAWQRDASRVICVVTDRSSSPPVLVPADLDAESGRGLQVVQALASSWGWMMLGSAQKAVWAALHLAASSLLASRRLPAPVLAVTGLVTASAPAVAAAALAGPGFAAGTSPGRGRQARPREVELPGAE